MPFLLPPAVRHAVVALLLATAAHAATASWSGTCTDAHTGLPLARARIQVGHLQIASDEFGAFGFTLDDSAGVRLQISHVGYRTVDLALPLPTHALSVKLEPTDIVLPGLYVTASRAVEGETPTAFTEWSATRISANPDPQETPLVLAALPNTYAYADAGNGVGNTYLKIRGFGQDRIGVMINGVPLNDPEDHQVYWVDMPDLLGSVTELQVQRGVTHSLYGVGAFAGSVNLVTGSGFDQPGLQVRGGRGSYGTRRGSIAMNSVSADSQSAVHARFSRLVSDGYRRDSGVDQWAYFLGLSRRGRVGQVQANVYGGPEITHAAWDGLREDQLALDRRYNPTSAGYANTVDHFNQPHYELIHTAYLASGWQISNTLFLVQGRGYYEGLKRQRALGDFALPSVRTTDPTWFGADSLAYYTHDGDQLQRDNLGQLQLARTDLVRQKWVDKQQVGWMGRLERVHPHGRLTIGSEISGYRGRHWGKVVWAAAMPAQVTPNLTYYRYRGRQATAALYLHELYIPRPDLRLMAEMQLQQKEYRFAQDAVGALVGAERNAYRVRHRFANPRAGVTWQVTPNLGLFASAALAQREPADADYYDTWEGPDDRGADPLFARSDTLRAGGQITGVRWHEPLVDPEQVMDFELGTVARRGPHQLHLNAYWLDLRHEIVAYGQLDDEGNPVRGNARRTVRRGLEATVRIALATGLDLEGSGAVSRNYFADYTHLTWAADGSVVGLDYAGHTLPLFPQRLATLRLVYARGIWASDGQLQYAGPQQLDDSNSAQRRLPGHTTVDVGLHCRLDPVGLTGVRLEGLVRNAAGARYSGSGYYDEWAGARYLFPAATRSYYVGLSGSW